MRSSPPVAATDWNLVAEQYSNIQDARRLIVFPYLRDQVRLFEAKTLLDYGGGDGEFVRYCADIPDIALALYDPTPRMTSIADGKTKELPNVCVVTSLGQLPKSHFDIVTATAVWMCLDTEEKCARMLQDVHTCLRTGGLLMASVTHPCFRHCQFSTYSTDFDPARYMDNATQFSVTLDDGQNALKLVDTHWNLSAMTTQLYNSGFAIRFIKELPDLPAERERIGAPWLVLVAEKHNNEGSLAGTPQGQMSE